MYFITFKERVKMQNITVMYKKITIVTDCQTSASQIFKSSYDAKCQ